MLSSGELILGFVLVSPYSYLLGFHVFELILGFFGLVFQCLAGACVYSKSYEWVQRLFTFLCSDTG